MNEEPSYKKGGLLFEKAEGITRMRRRFGRRRTHSSVCRPLIGFFGVKGIVCGVSLGVPVDVNGVGYFNADGFHFLDHARCPLFRRFVSAFQLFELTLLLCLLDVAGTSLETPEGAEDLVGRYKFELVGEVTGCDGL